jgi:hypothetical protein
MVTSSLMRVDHIPASSVPYFPERDWIMDPVLRKYKAVLFKAPTAALLRIKVSVLALVLCAAFPLLLRAQFDTAVVVGKVTDPAGAVVSGADVTLRNVDLGTIQTKKTSDQGAFEFPGIQIGLYIVTIKAPGFETVTTEPINVTVDSRPRVDIAMKVGATSDTVTVSDAAAGLDRDSSDRGFTVQQREIEDLPLNGREYTDLALLTPGVQVSALQDGTITQRRGSFNVNGNRSSVNNFLLDGLDNNSYQPANQGFNNEAITESVDAVSQFKIQTDNYSAEYGRSGGAIVNVSTMSGTNEIHGRVWEYIRNTVFDAFGPFYGPAGVKPTLIQNQFGVAVGGPIRHNSIFWFADYEGFRQVTTSYQTATLPTLNQRNGIFGTPLKNPYTGVAHANGIIPSTDITPFAAEVLAALPIPGVGETYTSLPKNLNFRDIGDVRLDAQPIDRLHLLLRYTQQSNHILEGPHIPGPAGGDGNGHTRILATGLTSGATYTVSANQLLDFRLGFIWNESGKVPTNQGQPSINALYSSPVSTNPYLQASLNTQDIASMSYFGVQNTDPQYSNPSTINVKINDTYVHANHSFSFGYEYLALMEAEDVNSAKLGEDIYNGHFSEASGGSAANADIADFLYGARSTYDLSNFDPNTIEDRFHYAYVEDTWHAASRLTLNLGLRYEFQIPQWTKGNLQSNFDPTTDTLILARPGSIYSQSLVNTQKTNFAPRAGFAFTSNPKTVWRGAYGISYIQFNRYSSQGGLDLNGPSSINSSVEQTISEPLCPAGSPGPTCFSPTQQGYPLSIITPAFFSNTTSQARYIPKDSPTGYVQSYFAGVQQQFDAATILNIDYVGNHSVRLRVLGDLNQASLQPTATSSLSLAQRRPIPGFIDIYDNLSSGFLRYNSLQVQIQHRTKQFFFTNSFTWARAIDNAVADLEEYYGDSSYVNIANIKGDTGTSGYNQPLNDTLAGLWNIPYKSRKANGLGEEILGNWQLTTITKLTSGVPINLTYDPSAAAETTTLPYAYRPNITGPHSMLMNPRSQWVKTNTAVLNVFNTSEVSIPSQTVVYGNAPRNVVRGTPYYDVDLGVHKQFPIKTKEKIEFRAEAFNVLNHTSWKAAASDYSAATYGQLSPASAFPSRIVQLAIRIYF